MPKLETLHPARIRTQIYFPDKRLLQYDCGKLQALVGLLRDLKKDGHRALIFTQMTKMLDILEAFLNIHGYTYLRLDGAVRVDQRLSLMERFNNDPRIFLFILTTRTGGLGINLTGADTVIFYDSDWNPAMDAQAQDRSHRIGQTREVHIWRLVSEFTIEENILKKARQKLALDQIIKDGNFTTESFQKTDIRELMSDAKNEMIGEESGADRSALGSSAFDGTQSNISDKEMEQALLAAEDETDVAALRMVRREEAEENEEDFGDDPNQPQSLVDPDDPLMSRLTAIQRYAVKFLEEVNPVIDKEALALQSEFIEAEEKEWERDTLRRLQEGQRSDDEELDDDDDDDITPIRTRSPALPSFVISNSSTAPKRGRPVTTGASSVDGAKRKRGRPPRKRKNANRGEDEFRLDGGGDDEGQGDMAMTYEG
jgi:E1A-binding protein p400